MRIFTPALFLLAAVSLSSQANAQTTCAKVKHYAFSETGPFDLTCDAANRTVIMTKQIPTTGRAAARAYMKVQNTDTQEIYFWNADVQVGQGIIHYRSGDDICPASSPLTKQVLGYGDLKPWNQTVKVSGHQGNSSCVDGKMKVTDVELRVWVEDPNPDCLNETIQADSFYSRNKPLELNSQWFWPYQMTTALQQSVTTDSDDTGLIVLSDTEATVWSNPNTVCGLETATVAAQVNINGINQYSATSAIPASTGMGHLKMFNYSAVPVASGTHDVTYALGRNFGGTTNKPPQQTHIVTSGGNIGGDTTLITIKY